MAKFDFNRKNFDKGCKLHKVCKEGEKRNNPVFECVYFLNGRAYVSEGHVIVSANIKSISTLEQETIDALNGHCLCYDDYAELLKYDTFKVTDTEIVTYSYDKNMQLAERCHFTFAEKRYTYFFGSNCANVASEICREANNNSLQHINFNYKYLSLITDCMGYKEECIIFTITYSGRILVHLTNCASAEDHDIFAVLMPSAKNGADYDYINKRYDKQLAEIKSE